VHVVPAFVGLGAPYWEPNARGAIVGITRGTTRAHIVRAALESIAFQVRDVTEAMAADCGGPLHELRVDGGASASDVLMQMQADTLGVRIVRPKITETTALGAAYLAGLATGFWESKEQIEALWTPDRVFEPSISAGERERGYEGWKEAVERVR
jgi:glycerol kinase